MWKLTYATSIGAHYMPNVPANLATILIKCIGTKLCLFAALEKVNCQNILGGQNFWTCRSLSNFPKRQTDVHQKINFENTVSVPKSNSVYILSKHTCLTWQKFSKITAILLPYMPPEPQPECTVSIFAHVALYCAMPECLSNQYLLYGKYFFPQ